MQHPSSHFLLFKIYTLYVLILLLIAESWYRRSNERLVPNEPPRPRDHHYGRAVQEPPEIAVLADDEAQRQPEQREKDKAYEKVRLPAVYKEVTDSDGETFIVTTLPYKDRPKPPPVPPRGGVIARCVKRTQQGRARRRDSSVSMPVLFDGKRPPKPKLKRAPSTEEKLAEKIEYPKRSWIALKMASACDAAERRKLHAPANSKRTVGVLYRAGMAEGDKPEVECVYDTLDKK